VSNPNVGTQVRILARRHGWTDEETLEAFIDLALSTPGIPSRECPF
jgi:hypothetical protein